jgi:hypothetical protein
VERQDLVLVEVLVVGADFDVVHVEGLSVVAALEFDAVEADVLFVD